MKYITITLALSTVPLSGNTGFLDRIDNATELDFRELYDALKAEILEIPSPEEHHHRSKAPFILRMVCNETYIAAEVTGDSVLLRKSETRLLDFPLFDRSTRSIWSSYHDILNRPEIRGKVPEPSVDVFSLSHRFNSRAVAQSLREFISGLDSYKQIPRLHGHGYIIDVEGVVSGVLKSSFSVFTPSKDAANKNPWLLSKIYSELDLFFIDYGEIHLLDSSQAALRRFNADPTIENFFRERTVDWNDLKDVGAFHLEYLDERRKLLGSRISELVKGSKEPSK